MAKMRIIKTLKHLNVLILNTYENCISAGNYSYEAYEYINSAKLFAKENLKFSELIKFINNTDKNTNEIVDEFRINKPLKYTRVETLTGMLDLVIKGDTISIWAVGYDNPLRISFFGEDCEKIEEYDVITGRSIKEHEGLALSDTLPSDTGVVSDINVKISGNTSLEKIIFTDKQIKNLTDFHVSADVIETDYVFPPLFFANEKLFISEVKKLKTESYSIYINSKKKISELKEYYTLSKGFEFTFQDLNFTTNKSDLKSLGAGFISNSNKVAYFTDREVVGTITLNRSYDSSKIPKNIKKLVRQLEGSLEIGNYIVHEDYGVGIYKGLKQEEADGQVADYALIEFANKDELFVPLSQVNKITKYISNEGVTPILTNLGKKTWEKTRETVKKTTWLTAKELVEHYAKRELSKADPVESKDSEEYKAFTETFKFKETPDQITAINEVLNDLEQSTPMDRILVGDVGFGKTEVIIRAAFKVVESGGQVAILSPTTVLTTQHFNVFSERFKKTGFNVGFVSRFNTPAENRKVIDDLNEGNINIIIGTHRLLSSDVKFKNLKLLVVDEEQKFGVKQKEKIKKLNYGVHVLAVTATPIPRSLSLALSSIQDISIITTPPVGRKPVETEIIYNNWEKAANAIQSEVSRGGQVFFLHNKVQSIQSIVRKLESLIPNINIEFAHGHMASGKLDRIMTDFLNKKFDCLVSTTIVENGLDLPNVNTMIIHNAHTFGLSQLYQLRGRVGRSELKAYCYLMSPKPGKKDATIDKKRKRTQDLYMERLNSLVENQDLGAGFRIASRDLEIRGAGSILGEEQHGHISRIGYALYIEMLAQAIEKLKHEGE